MTAKQIVGALILVAVIGGFYLALQNEVKISITGSQTQFYVWENSKWNSSGIEKNYLYNGSKNIPRGLTSVTNRTYGNESNITRNALYSKSTITDAYNFNGSITDKALIPVTEIHDVINGKGLTYIYEITGYDGGYSPQSYSMDFAKKMKVIWKRAPDSITVKKMSGGKVRLRLNYTVQSDFEEYDIRLFDPSTVTIYLNSSSADRKFELGDIINITACSSTAGDTVFLNSSYPGKGTQYTSNTTCVTDLWNSSSGTTSFTDGANKTISANGNVNITVNAVSEITSGTFLVNGSSNGLTKNVSIDIGNDGTKDIQLFGNITNDQGYYTHFSDYSTSKVLSFQGKESKYLYYNIIPGVSYSVTNFSIYGMVTNYTQNNFTTGTTNNITINAGTNSTIYSTIGGSSIINSGTLTLKGRKTYTPTSIISYQRTASDAYGSGACSSTFDMKAHNGTITVGAIVGCSGGVHYSVTDTAGCDGPTYGYSGLCWKSCQVDFGQNVIDAKTVTISQDVCRRDVEGHSYSLYLSNTWEVTNAGNHTLITNGSEYTTNQPSDVSVWLDVANASNVYSMTGLFNETNPAQVTLNKTNLQSIADACGTSSCTAGIKIYSATYGAVDNYNLSINYEDTPKNVTVETGGTQVFNYADRLNSSVSPKYVDLGGGAFQVASSGCTGMGCTITVKVTSDRSGNITVNTSKINYTINAQNITASAISNFIANDHQYDKDAVLILPFREGTGNITYDISGYGNNGNMTNMNKGINNGSSGWTTSGKYGNATMFDGINDNISLGAPSSLNSSKYTISLWFKTDNIAYSFNGRKMIAVTQNSGIKLGIQLDYPTYATMVWNAGSTSGYYLSNAANDGNWHQAGLTYNGTKICGYFDGDLIECSDTTLFSNYTGVVLGGYGDYFNGTLDEIKIWNRSLNATEMTSEYNSGSEAHEKYLRVYDSQVPMNVSATNWGSLNFHTLQLFGKWDANFTWAGVTNATGATNDSQNVMIVWSNLSTIFPAKTKEPIFIGKYGQTQNITPYGQTSAVAGVNFSYLAREQCMNISVYTNATINPCMNVTMSSTSSKTAGRFFNTTNPNNIITNLCSGYAGIWFWLDMNSSCAQQTRPYIFYKPKCVGCV
jgi:hypothetical protein